MKKSLIAILHVGYWFVYLLLAMIMMYAVSSSGSLSETVGEEVIATAFFFMVLLPAVVTFYTFYLVLFPRYFGRKQFGLAFLIGGLVSVGTTLLGFAILGTFFYPECVAEMDLPGFLFFVSIVSFFNLLGGVVAFVLQGFSTWFEEVKIKEALQEKNHAMELALVKSQLDPHFLFNTINNIDVLILKDADEASDYLNRLSDIMRFMLYETKTETIALSREVAYIEKYIALQKIRTANETYVDFRLIGSPAGRVIAPMVFIPFIENAFKHTTNKKVERAIRIELEVMSEAVRMSCVNRLDPSRNPPVAKGGLGNELIRKRLELLYPGKHHLEVRNELNEYHVNLLITT
ncbi:sensor histidine kinase [Neolewinella persica]|uniref:sensor histidine kinase n=1 Tax=Neolewinella persica TaxID=70998 RepID=UPI000360155A|nr:histidine kinase [Neolewinella persica]